MKFFQLLWSFLKIGAFTFGGGYAMIPLIEREVVERRKWIAEDEFPELLSLAQTAPGPISLNASAFVGYKVGGWRGALAAVAGVVVPSFVVILVIAVWFADLRFNRWVDAAFTGMRPAVVALMAAPLIRMAKGMEWWKIAIAIAAALIVWRLGVSPIYFMIAGAGAGIILTYRDRKEDNI